MMVPGVAASFTNSTTIGPPPQAVPASQLLRTNTAMAYSSRYNFTANYSNVRHNQYDGHHQQHHRNMLHYHCNDTRYPMTSPTTSLPATPPDNNNFPGGVGYYHVGGHTGSTGGGGGSSVSPSLSSSSPPTPPSSSSSAVMPAATYHRGRHHQQHHVYAPTAQTHDCHGVPAHPSVADYPSSPLAQYHHQQLPYYAPQQPVSSPPRAHLHNNNNNYLPSLSCELLEDVKSDKSAAGYK